MTADCEYLAACPIFAHFRADGIKNFWIQLYRKGHKQENCARKQLKAARKEVPRTLLPNGEHLASLAK